MGCTSSKLSRLQNVKSNSDMEYCSPISSRKIEEFIDDCGKSLDDFNDNFKKVAILVRSNDLSSLSSDNLNLIGELTACCRKITNASAKLKVEENAQYLNDYPEIFRRINNFDKGSESACVDHMCSILHYYTELKKEEKYDGLNELTIKRKAKDVSDAKDVMTKMLQKISPYLDLVEAA